MKISARNVLPGTVTAITKGAVNAEIILSLHGGETIVAVITNPSVDRLGLQAGPRRPPSLKRKTSYTLDGKPIGADGAFKMISTEEKRPARWVKNLDKISVITVTP